LGKARPDRERKREKFVVGGRYYQKEKEGEQSWPFSHVREGKNCSFWMADENKKGGEKKKECSQALSSEKYKLRRP